MRDLLPAETYAELYISDWADQTIKSDDEDAKKEAEKEDGKKLKPVFDHLVLLQKVLSDYTSSLITEKRTGDSRFHFNKRNGALMFTDFAGFTKLMEANSSKGKEGAENLLKLLNEYFTAMIETITMSGGELLEFTGDALLVLFPAPLDEKTHEADLQKAVSKAVRAGLRMQKKMLKKNQEIEENWQKKLKEEEEKTGKKIEGDPKALILQIRIGIHAGHFYSADIGTPRRRDHVLLGKNVQNAKLTESYGANNKVNISPDAYQYVSDKFEFTPNSSHEGYMLVEDNLEEKDGYEIMAKTSTRRLASTMLLDKSFSNTYLQITNLLNAIRELASFIPLPVLNMLVESAARRKVSAEFPTPTIMFVNFIGLPEMIDKGIYQEESIIATFNEAFAHLNASVEKRGGVLKKVTYHLTGSDIVIYFGVPTAHTNDPMRAASAAVEIREIIQRINKEKIPKLKEGCAPETNTEDAPLIYCKIGINVGPTFVAEIGDPRGRREFNVLGDTVNTTARLMSKAGKNEIYISESVMEQIEEKYECLNLGEISLKGKGAPVPIFKLEKKKSKTVA